MISRIINLAKQYAFSLRISILSIFVLLLVIGMLTIIVFTHFRFTKNMNLVAFSLMQEASAADFREIQHEIEDATLRSESTGRLIQKGVIDTENLDELVIYTHNFMQRETQLLPTIQSVYWANTQGSLVAAQRQPDGTISSTVINRGLTPPTNTQFYRDLKGNVVKTVNSTDFSFDPRTRPWFLLAEQTKQTSWTHVFPNHLNGYLGTSVSTPVFHPDGSLYGVFSLNIRLDYLRGLLERTKLSEHSLLFLVTKDGKLVAIPNVMQYQNPSLMDIHQLRVYPWVTRSFDLFQRGKKKEFMFNYEGVKYLATYQNFSRFGSEQWLIGAVVPEDDFTGVLRQTHIITVAISLALLLLGIIVIYRLIAHFTKPLRKVAKEIEKIKNFELEGNIRIHSQIAEVAYIAEALYAMKKGLRSFQKYLPATLIRQLIETGEDARIGGTKKPLTILFSDIQRFTSIAEQMDPEQLLPHICEYFDELSHIIVSRRGTIDKYIGDSIMAFWGAPVPVPDASRQAALAAISCVQRLAKLNAKWQAEGKPALFTRFGIHSGEAIVGNLGSSQRLNYTAIGDATNIASRLEKINKTYGTQIIVSEAVYQEIKDEFTLRLLDQVSLRGKAGNCYIYELIAVEKANLPYDLNAYLAAFALGFAAYQNQSWDEAILHFFTCLEINPEDSVAKLFIKRCVKLKEKPPREWDGTWH